ncbi:MAG: xylulokinase, partial [Firmicutes bacterium]|nr:xylulokinase [Bacillota bacterium]
VSQGSAFTTLGTSAVVYAVSDRMVLDPKGRIHTLCASVPGKWTVMSCTQAAGLSLQWLRNNVCTAEMEEAAKKGVDPYEIMTAMAEKVPVGSEKLIYLPYLMGERSPHPDPDCRGVFFGLSAMHEKAHLIRSVMEGISFSQWECVEVFREIGVAIEDMMICGGGARSPFWRQMLSDMYGCPVSTMQSDRGGALGGAILAGVGAGIYSDLETACKKLILKKDVSLPDMSANKEYEPYFALYKELYKTLFSSFKTLRKI